MLTTAPPPPFPSMLLHLHFNLQPFFLNSGRMGTCLQSKPGKKMSSCQVANRTVTGSAYSLARFRCFLYRREIWAEHIKKCIRIGLQKILNPVNWSLVSLLTSVILGATLVRTSSRRAPAGADGAFLLCAKAGQTQLGPDFSCTSLRHPADLFGDALLPKTPL